ncbi:MAG: site-specific DNA-methyltransferase [candidate division Zixibacteria bacterium]|nr:site-specific DNA-methyltransferase [candidate division Zixibacteria bacterium]
MAEKKTYGKKTSQGKKIPVESIKHKDKRANIPTEELRDFVAEEETRPPTMRYPRDPSLDPQLVWKGKDEQDGQDLEVPVVPIYIQEKIQPQAIVENVRREASAERPEQEPNLFGDFNGMAFDKQVDFYHHEANWSNRMILGDSRLVMTSLAEKEGLKGKVQMIYLDPPYGIKFGSNWQVSTRKRDVKDGRLEDATRQPEQIRAFRDTWKLGINSYLAYLRDRFVIARDLLTETGSIFVQIGDENVHLVRCLMDEVFGKENFCGEIIVEKTSGAAMEHLDLVADFILFYGKDSSKLKYRPLYRDKYSMGSASRYYRYIQMPYGMHRPIEPEESVDPSQIPSGARIFSIDALTSQTNASTTRYNFEYKGGIFQSGVRQWATPREGMNRLLVANRVTYRGTSIGFVRYLEDFSVRAISNVWSDISGSIQSRTDPKVYVVQTSTTVIQRCLLMTTDPGDLVLDPTCGSGTTAYVAEQYGRRWITIDTSRVSLALARTRIMAARYPYYHLADSPDGIMKEAEITGQIPPEHKTDNDIKRGFVYRRVPHITLKSIANNPEIDAIHASWQEKLEPILADLNKALKTDWKEWQVPRPDDDDPVQKKWPAAVRKLFAQWWEHRRARQKEIDDSIARHADTEMLYDQPYEDNKRIRVAGPFTVESLSPFRMLPADRALPAGEVAAQKESSDQFIPMVIENLKKAGVQNTRRNERLKFDLLAIHPGVWIHAVGEYTDAEGKARRVAVSVGPEFGTVSPQQVKEAAKEAVKGIGYDLLVICGYAFDPHVSEEIKRYGKLAVLPTRMNEDLKMADDLLKKTGVGNLFMVFGEPDLAVTELSDGKLQVAIKGVDVYDPTTGEIRSSSTDDIACWFIDTDYNGESFFVRHAYFLGADQPYDRLKRALRAEIDESAWSMLYSAQSNPFDKPKSGKFAVKVINHYGDEVLKVYTV